MCSADKILPHTSNHSYQKPVIKVWFGFCICLWWFIQAWSAKLITKGSTTNPHMAISTFVKKCFFFFLLILIHDFSTYILINSYYILKNNGLVDGWSSKKKNFFIRWEINKDLNRNEITRIPSNKLSQNHGFWILRQPYLAT